MDQSTESVKESAKRVFRWTSHMIGHLLLFLNNFRSSMEQKGKTFPIKLSCL